MKNIALKVALACCTCAFCAALAGCVTINVQGGSSASSSGDASTAASSSSSASTASSSSSNVSSPSTPSATGQAKYDLGNVYFLNVHDSDSGVVADAAVEIVNTGDVPLVVNAPSITIYNASGAEIVKATGNALFTGPSYLRPGDISYIYTGSPIAMPSGYTSADDYKITAAADVSACKEAYEYPITNKAIGDNGFGMPAVTGTVTNDDTENASLIEISAVFFDNENNLLGVASDLVIDLAPGASETFTIDGLTLPVGCSLAMVSDYDVIAMGVKY